MTRTTDDLQDKDLWQPLGERVERRPPAKPEWQPLPHAPSIEVNRQGQLRTNLPLPKEKP
jgi:hypothetical protein